MGATRAGKYEGRRTEIAGDVNYQIQGLRFEGYAGAALKLLSVAAPCRIPRGMEDKH